METCRRCPPCAGSRWRSRPRAWPPGFGAGASQQPPALPQRGTTMQVTSVIDGRYTTQRWTPPAPAGVETAFLGNPAAGQVGPEVDPCRVCYSQTEQCAAGDELTEQRFGCLGLGLEVYQGDAGLAYRTELTISSLVDISSPGAQYLRPLQELLLVR